MMDLSVVIPGYGSHNILHELCEWLLRVLAETGLEHEVIFVNDDSPDDAWGVLVDLHSAHREHVMAVRLTRNFGQHNAIMCGFHHARGRYVSR